MAVLVLLSLIGTAIGLGIVDPTSSDPLSGLGTGAIIWTVITMILAFMAGGFISGLASRRVGLLHGFLTWATSVVLLFIMVSYVVSSSISAVGTLMGNAFSVVGDGATTVVSGVGNVIENGVNLAVSNVDGVNTDQLQVDIREILRDTETEELQPGYLNNQLNQSANEIANAGRELLLNPENANQIITDLTNSLQERAQTIGQAVDRDAIAQSVAANTNLNENEALQATDNIYDGLMTATTQAENALDNATQTIEQLQFEVEQTLENARIQADQAADATVSASIWTFVGLLIAMILTTLSVFLVRSSLKIEMKS